MAFALVGGGLVRRSPDVIRAGLALFLAVGLLAGAVYLTGGPASVEDLPGVSEAAIEAHEAAAVAATVVLGSLALLALGGRIRHPEIAPAASSAAASPGAEVIEAEEED